MERKRPWSTSVIFEDLKNSTEIRMNGKNIPSFLSRVLQAILRSSDGSGNHTSEFTDFKRLDGGGDLIFGFTEL
ncbi:hypothetical protein ACTXT7_014661 [Hymenolepis weldensis]